MVMHLLEAGLLMMSGALLMTYGLVPKSVPKRVVIPSKRSMRR